VLVDRTFCTSSSDNARRDNSPRAAGEVNGGAGPQREVPSLSVIATSVEGHAFTLSGSQSRDVARFAVTLAGRSSAIISRKMEAMQSGAYSAGTTWARLRSNTVSRPHAAGTRAVSSRVHKGSVPWSQAAA
jgi:hypothetical protein